MNWVTAMLKPPARFHIYAVSGVKADAGSRLAMCSSCPQFIGPESAFFIPRAEQYRARGCVVQCL